MNLPLGTNDIIAVDIETCECDLQEIWKELWQMVNEISEKVKALAESNKAMKEELSRLQQDTKKELQLFESMENPAPQCASLQVVIRRK